MKPMRVLRWSDDLSTGVTFLDQENQALLERYLALIDDMESNADFSRFLDGMERIAADTQIHFLHQEQVMRNIEYPGYSAHRDAHHRLIEGFSEFINNLGVGFSKEHLAAVTEYFGQWFMSHVKEHDVGLKQYLDRPNEQFECVPRGARRLWKRTSRSSKRGTSPAKSPPKRSQGYAIRKDSLGGH